MTVTTESGRQNAFPNETRPYIDESVSYEGYPQNAEKVNGRWAMIGFVALLGAYATTGQIIPGVFSNGFHTSLLEVRRTSQWSPCDAWSSNRHNQLRSIRMDSTRFILK